MTASSGRCVQRLGALAVAGVLLAGCGGQPLEAAHDAPPGAPPDHLTPDWAERARAEAAQPDGKARDRSPAADATVPAPPVAADLEPVKRFRSVRGTPDAPAPTAVRIPGIGVSSPLERLGRDAAGTVEAPADWQRAGWFTEGARPGQPGPAVLLGHVDSRAGPAVFYRLHELRPGDEVLVDREDGSTVTFVVERVERHDKDAFPTRAVYFPTLEPTLRLVTCGGEFDRSVGSYRDNIVVFATQTG